MKIDVLTLFPGMFDNIVNESILKRAQAKGLLKIDIHDLRNWTHDNHRSADDKPFGGGAGMVMKIEPVCEALEEIGKKGRVVLLTPQGRNLNQKTVKNLAKEKKLVLICGHYEGVDERIRTLVDDEISIGDYILTCGELPALVVIDSVARLIPGVLGDDESIKFESFENNMLEYPQYTRPAEYSGMKVPEVLLSGNHNKIDQWRKAEALKRTKERRPDLLNPVRRKQRREGASALTLRGSTKRKRG